MRHEQATLIILYVQKMQKINMKTKRNNQKNKKFFLRKI